MKTLMTTTALIIAASTAIASNAHPGSVLLTNGTYNIDAWFLQGEGTTYVNASCSRRY